MNVQKASSSSSAPHPVEQRIVTIQPADDEEGTTYSATNYRRFAPGLDVLLPRCLPLTWTLELK